MNLYAILEVAEPHGPTVTVQQIRAAYRLLSKRWHPDVPGGDGKRFDDIKAAHDTLVDPVKRAVYDATGEIPETKQVRHPDTDALALIEKMIARVLIADRPIFAPVDVTAEELPGLLASMIEDDIKQPRQGLRVAERASRRAKALLKKVAARGDAENRVGAIIRKHGDTADTDITTFRGMIAAGERAIAIVREHDYLAEVLSTTVAA